jgi:hypothetical protein
MTGPGLNRRGPEVPQVSGVGQPVVMETANRPAIRLHFSAYAVPPPEAMLMPRAQAEVLFLT